MALKSFKIMGIRAVFPQLDEFSIVRNIMKKWKLFKKFLVSKSKWFYF